MSLAENNTSPFWKQLLLKVNIICSKDWKTRQAASPTYQDKEAADGWQPSAIFKSWVHPWIEMKWKGMKKKDGWSSRMSDRWTVEMQGSPLALVIKLHNCADNDSVCLQVKTLHDAPQRRLCHLTAELKMSFWGKKMFSSVCDEWIKTLHKWWRASLSGWWGIQSPRLPKSSHTAGLSCPCRFGFKIRAQITMQQIKQNSLL